MSRFEHIHKSIQSGSNGDSSVPDSINYGCQFDKVSNAENSMSSVFDTNAALPEEPTFVDLQPLTDLSLDDSSIFLQRLPSDIFSTPFLGADLSNSPGNISIGPITPSVFDDIFIGNSIIKKEAEFTPVQSHAHVGVSATVCAPTRTETRFLSTSSIFDESEGEDVQQRNLKKTGQRKRQVVRFGNKEVVKNTKEYHSQRLKNNEAVKKSRQRSKQKQKESESQMRKLATENKQLNERVNHLVRELQVLKSLYQGVNQQLPPDAVRALERINLR